MTNFTGLNGVICAKAFTHIVYPAIESAAGSGIANKMAGNMTVLHPGIPYEPKYIHAITPDGEIQPEFFDLVLWEHCIGDPEDPDIKKYMQIARAKAFTSYLTGMPSHLVQQGYPHLFVPGMTKWGGSAVSGTGPIRLISSFSGVQWNFDQMFSEMMNSAVTALCHEEMRAVMASGEAMIIGKPLG